MFRVPIFLCILLFSVLILDVAGFGLSPFSVNGEVSLRKGLQTSRSPRMKMAISTLEDSKPRMGRAEGISSTKPPLGIWEFATNWHWGVQDPGIPLPIKVVEGQPPELCTVVTQEHLNTLARDGVVLIKGVLNKSWIEYLRRIIDWQVSHPHVLALAGVISNLYDYVQRCAWRTNPGFADFLYYSPVASALGQLAGCGWFPDGDRRGHHEIRISTDLLLVNPNKGFQWHQDEQNGPLTAGRGSERLDALRYWITVDDTRADFGAPVYLKGSQENDFVDRDVVFVDMEANGVLARCALPRPNQAPTPDTPAPSHPDRGSVAAALLSTAPGNRRANPARAARAARTARSPADARGPGGPGTRRRRSSPRRGT